MTGLSLTKRSKVLVLTGAGVSAESGVPTFRGQNGLWEGHRVEDVASPEGYARDPELVWRFYSLRREAVLRVEPNPGHFALVELERALGERFLLATQNVDGLHARAGSTRLIAMHGELFQSRCSRCAVPFHDERTFLSPPLPTCERCGSDVRPHIVWFGETLDSAHMDAIGKFMARAGRDLVFIAVGTSGLVYPAAGLVNLARAFGGRTALVDLDPDPNVARQFDEVWQGASSEVLPALFASEIV